MAYPVQNLKIGDYIELESDNQSFLHGNSKQLDKNLPVIIKDRNVKAQMVRVEFNNPNPDHKFNSYGDLWINEHDIKGKCTMSRAVDYERIRSDRKLNNLKIRMEAEKTKGAAKDRIKITLPPPEQKSPPKVKWVTFGTLKLDSIRDNNDGNNDSYDDYIESEGLKEEELAEEKEKTSKTDKSNKSNKLLNTFRPGQKVIIKPEWRDKFHYQNSSNFPFCDAAKPFVIGKTHPSDPNAICVKYNHLYDGVSSSKYGDFWLYAHQIDLIGDGDFPRHPCSSIFMPDKVEKNKVKGLVITK